MFSILKTTLIISTFSAVLAAPVPAPAPVPTQAALRTRALPDNKILLANGNQAKQLNQQFLSNPNKLGESCSDDRESLISISYPNSQSLLL
jgi:hypothetical protein